MKYSDIVKPLGVPTEGASLMIGNEQLFNRMVRAGWIEPVVDKNRCRIFDVKKIEECFKRLKLGDYPADQDNA